MMDRREAVADIFDEAAGAPSSEDAEALLNLALDQIPTGLDWSSRILSRLSGDPAVAGRRCAAMIRSAVFPVWRPLDPNCEHAA